MMIIQTSETVEAREKLDDVEIQKDGTTAGEQPPLNRFTRSARTAVVPVRSSDQRALL